MTWKQVVLEWLEREERSQSWLSRKAGLNPNYLSAILNDIRHAGPRALGKLEKAMDLPVGTLVALQSQTQLPMEEVSSNGHAV